MERVLHMYLYPNAEYSCVLYRNLHHLPYFPCCCNDRGRRFRCDGRTDLTR